MGKSGDISIINHSVRFKIDSSIFFAYSVMVEKLPLNAYFRTIHLAGKKIRIRLVGVLSVYPW